MKKGKIKKSKPNTGIYKCERCQHSFDTRRKLKLHSNLHIMALKEIELLRQGKMPSETKDGGEFKGKNRVVIS